MKAVYCLFEVFGDGDGIENFELVSVHEDGAGAELAACNLRAEDVKRYTPIDEIVEAFNRPYFHIRRVDYIEQLHRVSECGLGYGEFGGFVIERLTVQ